MKNKSIRFIGSDTNFAVIIARIKPTKTAERPLIVAGIRKLAK